MDPDDLRDSGDDEELADLDERDDEVEDPVDGMKKETESSSSESHPENQASTSHKPPKRSRSKSRVETLNTRVTTPNPAPPPKRTWRSANAFVNFVQDFKKDYPDMIMGRNIFQICSERWKNMSDEQKQPYIAAANTVKRLKQRKIGDNGDQQVKKPVTRVSKRKAETKRKETIQKRSKVNNRDAKSNTDTDTATNI